MILTAATAIGCGLTLSLDRSTDRFLSKAAQEFLEQCRTADWDSVKEFLEQPVQVGGAVLSLCLLSMPLVATWTLAFIPLRLINPRPVRRRIATQPGLMAGSASSVAITCVGPPIIILSPILGNLRSDVSDFGDLLYPMRDLTACGGMAILASWVTLLVGRRWRAESSWVDRGGRIMGVMWIAEGVAAWASTCLIWGMTLPGFLVRGPRTWADALADNLFLCVRLLSAALSLATLAYLVLSFFGPRPRHRWRARRPGMMAAIVSVTTLVALWLTLASVGIAFEDLDFALYGFLDEDTTHLGALCVGLAVLACWTTLLLGRRWRPAPTWADRLGRALGGLWIITALAASVGAALTPIS